MNGSPTAPPAVATGCTCDVLAEQSVALAAGLRELSASWSAQEAAWQQQRLDIGIGRRSALEPLERELATFAADAAAADAVRASGERRQRRLAAITAAASRMRRQVQQRLLRQVDDLRAAEVAEARARMAVSAGRKAELLRSLQVQRQRLQEQQASLLGEAVSAGLRMDEPGAESRIRPAAGIDAAVAAAAAAAAEGLPMQLDQVDASIDRFQQAGALRCLRPWARLGLHGAALLPLAIPPLTGGAASAWLLAGVAAAVGQGAVLGLTAHLRRRMASQAGFIATVIADLRRRLAGIERALADPASVPDQAVVSGDESPQRQGRQRDLQVQAERDAQAVREREQRLRRRIEAAAAAEDAQAEAGARQRIGRARQAVEERIASVIAAADARQAAADAAWQQTAAGLRERAAVLTSALAASCAEAGRRGDADHPPWSDAGWNAWRPASAWPVGIPLGRIRADLPALVGEASAGMTGLPQTAFAAPVLLPFPGAGGLIIRTQPQRKQAGWELITTVILRALASCPSARVKVTIIDPAGLGQSFAPLLALADQGEAVLSGGIATDEVRIERALEDLAARAEAVIRTRLRHQHATIADYNREAGQLQEPMHLVAIADFPNRFVERAQERLATLMRNGPRCGIHLLLQLDRRLPVPPAIEAAAAQRGTLVLRDDDEGFVLDTPGLRGLAFIPETLPPAERVAQILAAIAAAAVRAARVEMPFAQVQPPAGQEWSLSTADRLRIPIGVRGGGQPQYLELGRGTAQHVLIGGRTGSGKSTLLHILVTSAAAWLHPRELELHLVDFKKGVEFQVYAAHRLPHARVVAIESDREFGLSVLRRLDGELNRRGETFRKAGVQDLATYRREGRHLPRILLLIDEFQELFTEDDAIARDAALLLDRFVRQGRAFGLHVVLGSQTLGGAYSLAKSSLGQIGVRIVLPCNESDAHLLLNEDNDGARLLSRPGDAIYNDQAGLAEGNSPFQVCWLGDQEHAAVLRGIAARTAADGWRPPVAPVVFAGDAPSRLEDEPQLAALLDGPLPPAERRAAAWLGLSSSLRGAAEVVFPMASGGNLLLAGQLRDAAAATLAAIALGLAVRQPPQGVQLIALDGDDVDGPFTAQWNRLAGMLPHGLRRFGGRDAGACLAEVAAVVDRRQAGDAERTPILLVVFGLQRLRALRPDEDFSLERAAGEPPAEVFARILAQGPEVAVHVACWCDSTAAIQRGLGRRSLREFDLRILFQMSAADSSELIDDDAASRLGLHNALFAALADGRREKFRPYQAVEADFLEQIGRKLQARPA